MNPVIEAIKNRRSTRRYTAQAVEQDQLRAVLDAGLWAPSAHNDQGWHVTVLRNAGLIAQLNAEIKEALKSSPLDWASAMGNSERFNVFYNAPVVLVVSGRKSALSPLVDCSALIQNILLAAESLGLGACWIGLGRMLFGKPDAVRKWRGLLAVSEGHDPCFCVTLGHRDGPTPKAPARREGNVNFVD